MAKFQVLLQSEWKDFEPQVNQLLVDALKQKQATLTIQTRGQEYTIDLRSMIQQNASTGTERQIRVNFSDEHQARQVAEQTAQWLAESAAETASEEYQKHSKEQEAHITQEKDKFGFSIDEQVIPSKSATSNPYVQNGEIGTVAGFTSDHVMVKFDKGIWNLPPEQLTKVSGDACDSGDIRQTDTEADREVQKEVWEGKDVQIPADANICSAWYGHPGIASKRNDVLGKLRPGVTIRVDNNAFGPDPARGVTKKLVVVWKQPQDIFVGMAVRHIKDKTQHRVERVDDACDKIVVHGRAGSYTRTKFWDLFEKEEALASEQDASAKTARQAAESEEIADKEAKDAEAAALAEARAAAEAEAKAEAEKKAAAEKDNLAIAVKLDEEAMALQAEGRLEEAKQKFVEASLLLNYVLKSDARTKNPKIKEMISTRMAEVIARAEQCGKLMESAPTA